MKKTKNPFEIENLNEYTGFLFFQTTWLWHGSQEKLLKKRHNISQVQYAVLSSIYWLILHTKREVTQIVLARHTKIDPMTISQIFKVLEVKGYIYRKTHSTDVRAKAVFLTETGEALVNEVGITVLESDNKFFQVLGKNITHFNQYLAALLKAND